MGTEHWTRRGAIVAGAGAATACGAPGAEAPAYDGEVAFGHGVASGDPGPDRVVIWTRVSPARPGPVPVRWIVARNRALSDLVKTGVTETSELRDYTVKIDVTGLRAGAPYFFGFRAGDAESPVGKTRTLPTGRLDTMRFAVASCASYAHGYFNVYAALAARDDIDLVVHLGDYIYEYGVAGYGGDTAARLGRIPSPEVECTRLADYRARHAQYKGDPALQAAHAIAPWIVVWDDHEIANDCWAGGAENHQQGEGDWASRKRAALQAYYEWMPIRDPASGRAFEAINRSFQFGDLFTLLMVETRLLARTQPLDYATQMPLAMQRWNFASPGAPIALRDHEADAAVMRRLPAVFEAVGEELRPVLDWRRAQALAAAAPDLPQGFYLAPDRAALDALLKAEGRDLMGSTQTQWLGQQLSASKRAGVAWQVIGNQVMMASVDAPDLSRTPPQLAAALEQLRPGVSRLLKLTRFAFPLSTDSWDGYPRTRDQVLAAIRASNANALILTGDTHAGWVNEVNDQAGRAALELGVGSVTSPSDGDYFAPFGIDFAAGVRARNANVKWCDPLHRGFLLVTLTREAATAEFFWVSTILSRDFTVERGGAFGFAPGGAIEAL